MLSPGAFRDIVVRSQYSDMAIKVEAARLMVHTAAAHEGTNQIQRVVMARALLA